MLLKRLYANDLLFSDDEGTYGSPRNNAANFSEIYEEIKNMRGKELPDGLGRESAKGARGRFKEQHTCRWKLISQNAF